MFYRLNYVCHTCGYTWDDCFYDDFTVIGPVAYCPNCEEPVEGVVCCT